MPIKVQCACGAAFAAKDELAGRTVKCPKCQQPLKIPAAGAAPVQPAVAGAQKAAAPAQRARPPQSSGASGINLDAEVRPRGPSDSAFDDVGLGARAAGTHPCPGCAAPLLPNAVLCIHCGYNLKLGRRIETVKIGGGAAPGQDGHGSAAQELLQRAAQSIEDDKEAERAKTREGMPWWVYLIGLMCVIGFLIMMMFIPQGTAMVVAASLMYGLASLIAFYAGIRMIIIAFSESVACGIMYLFLPFYGLYYIITRWDQCGGYFLMSLGANIVAGMAQGAMMFGQYLREHPADEEGAYLEPRARIAIVRTIDLGETTLASDPLRLSNRPC